VETDTQTHRHTNQVQ